MYIRYTHINLYSFAAGRTSLKYPFLDPITVHTQVQSGQNDVPAFGCIIKWKLNKIRQRKNRTRTLLARF